MKFIYIFIVFKILLLISKLAAQQPFNFLLCDPLGISTTESLYETDDAFYSFGTYQARRDIAIKVSAIDKKNGQITRSNILTHPIEYINLNDRTKIYEKDNHLYFGASGDTQFFLVAYNLENNDLYIADSLQNPFGYGAYIMNLFMEDDHYTLQGNFNDNSTNYNTFISRHKDGTVSYFHLQDPSPDHNLSPRVVKLENGHFLLFGSKNDYRTFIGRWTVTEIDPQGNIVWEVEGPPGQFIRVRDIVDIGDGHFIVLNSKRGRDLLTNRDGFEHPICKFDLKTKSLVWERTFNTNSVHKTVRGALVKSSRDKDAYISVMTTPYEWSRRDSIIVAGLATKFNGDGDIIWQKKYAYTTSRDLDMNFSIPLLPHKILII